MWTKDKIENYISSKIEENKHLEYKSSGALSKSEEKRKEISKDVSAFANSDGGTIIYGIKEFDESDKRHLPEKIDAILSNEFSKEWLENVIMGNISPKINDLKISSISIDDESERVVFVVEIPKSQTAHQASDNRYYKRYNFKSSPMDDWEVKDVINRSNKPIIEPRIYAVKDPKFSGSEVSHEFELLVILKNNGSIGAQQIEVYIEFEKSLLYLFKSPRPYIIDERIQLRFNNRKDNKANLGGKDVVISSYFQPLLPDVFREIGSIKVRKELFEKDIEFKCHIATEYGISKKKFKLQDIVKTMK